MNLKNMLRLVSRYLVTFFLAVPILISSILSLCFIQYTDRSQTVPYFLIAVSFFLICMEYFYNKKNKSIFPKIEISIFDEKILIIAGFVIFLFCLADLYYHGMPFFEKDVNAYGSFTYFQHHLRHFSSLVWLLAAFGLFIKNKFIKIIFLISSLAFPVLFLDRNRLLMSFFSISILFLFRFIVIKNKIFYKIAISAVLLGIILMFGYLGKIRSGQNNFLNVLEKSRAEQVQFNQGYTKISSSCIIPDKIPFKFDISRLHPTTLWGFSYVSIPVYNLATQYECQISNIQPLLNQIVPYYDRPNLNKTIPFVAPLLNVGTELLPFYLAGGLVLSFSVIILTALIIFLSSKLFIRTKNIFSFLFLTRILYCALFFNFAPQMYIFTTLAIGLVLLGLKGSSNFLKYFSYLKLKSEVNP